MHVRVDESAEVDDQNAATPEEPTPENGEPSSFAEKTKRWHERHKLKVRVTLGVTMAMGLGFVAHRHTSQGGERYNADDIGDFHPVSDCGATEPRRSIIDPDRNPFLRRLPTGQQASEAARERHRELTGDDLTPGYTSVRRWFFPSPEKEGSGEAAG